MSASEPPPVEPRNVQVESFDGVGRRSSAVLGVIAFILAILVFLMAPATTGLVNTEAFLDQAEPISITMLSIQVFAALGVFVLALVAALLRRGIGWAVSAMCISLVGAPMLVFWLAAGLRGIA